jgi:hypothetical protein
MNADQGEGGVTSSPAPGGITAAADLDTILAPANVVSPVRTPTPATIAGPAAMAHPVELTPPAATLTPEAVPKRAIIAVRNGNQ